MMGGMPGILVIVPCGASKIWARRPEVGAVKARDAYTGPPFVLHRQYAERFGDSWVILSAKYGLLRPEALLPGPYEVTFKKASTGPISVATLQEQVRRLALDQADQVVGLGGVEYRRAIEGAFHGTAPSLSFPFAGLSLGYSMQAVKRAIFESSEASADAPPL